MSSQKYQQPPDNSDGWQFPSVTSDSLLRKYQESNTAAAAYVSPDDDTSSSDERESHQQQQQQYPQEYDNIHVVPSIGGVTSWTIPLTMDESVSPMHSEDPMVNLIPNKQDTPLRSYTDTHANKRHIKRHLHDSHRKKRLHHIVPKESRFSHSTAEHMHSWNNPAEHRGNGFVLDLTTLFTQESHSKLDGTIAMTTTAKAASTNDSNFFGGTNSGAYSSPSLPPWKMQRAENTDATEFARTESPMVTPDQQDSFPNETPSYGKREELLLQWDTKSQTTQEAIVSERQCQALTQWINFVLVGDEYEDEKTLPSHYTMKSATSRRLDQYQVDSLEEPDDNFSCNMTPTAVVSNSKRKRQQRLSMFHYSQSYDCVIEQAHHWFQKSEQWKDLRRKIRSEISSGKVTLREDRDLYANIEVKEKLLDLFLSYRPAWLTLALEVVMSETITPAHGETLPSQKQLKAFILSHILSDEKLLTKYNQGGGSRVPSGQFGEKFHAELRPLVLNRILVLVFFLDRAAGRYQNSLGNLFHTNQEGKSLKTPVKSSAQVVVTICREFLSRQGDIIKQLARANLHVFHKQDRLDEIVFPIENFAIDLRDGVRISRLVEKLWLLPRNSPHVNETDKYPLLSQLRIPAISRLQKIHNVTVALAALQEDCQVGLPQDLQAHHIVDGQRRMVMRFVWTLVLTHCFQNDTQLTKQQLVAELRSVRKMRRQFEQLREEKRKREQDSETLHLLQQEVGDSESVIVLGSADCSKVSKKEPTSKETSRSCAPKLLTSESLDDDETLSCHGAVDEMAIVQEWKRLLMQWCQEVCMLVVTEVDKEEHENACSPKWTSVDLANGKTLCCLIHYYHPNILPREELCLHTSPTDSGPPTQIHTIETQPTSKRNKFRHVYQQRLTPAKMGPDYHIQLAHQRLSEVGGIPAMMLMPLTTINRHQRQRRKVSPLVEEKSVLVYLYHIAARLLKSRQQVQSIIFVQQRYRFLFWYSWLKRKRAASGVIWRSWRKNKCNYYLARSAKYKLAVLAIEEFTVDNFGKLMLLQKKRLERALQSKATVPIQAIARRFIAQKRYAVILKRHYAAITMQSQYRQYRDCMLYLDLRSKLLPAIIAIQRHWRGFQERCIYGRSIEAIIQIQAFIRGAALVRSCLLGSWGISSTCIQRIWRGFWAQSNYQLDLLDIVAVQCLVRKQQALQLARRKAASLHTIQRSTRVFVAKLYLLKLRQQRDACTMIQSSIRRYLATVAIARLRAKNAFENALVIVQRSWRRVLYLRERNTAATSIETRYRFSQARRLFLTKRAGAIQVQSQWRKHVAWKNYLRILHFIVELQSSLRKWFYGVIVVKHRLTALRSLQQGARRWLAVRTLEFMRQYRLRVIQKAVICQTFRRKNVRQREWQRSRSAIVFIQRRWRWHRWMKRTNRKWRLIWYLESCSKFFGQPSKGSFKIIPHIRRVGMLNKQAITRCGPKEISLSNVDTWTIPFHGHRQIVYQHRPHVKAMRQKSRSGVQLQQLPRRKIGVRNLRTINQGAVTLQQPWEYSHFPPPVLGARKAHISKDAVTKRYDRRRLGRAHKLLITGCMLLVQPITKSSESEFQLTSYQRVVHIVNGKSRALVKTGNITRLLFLVRRDFDLPPIPKNAIISPLSSANIWLTRAVELCAIRKIQCCWRRFAARKLTKESSAAKMIMSCWRCFAARLVLKKILATKSIQRCWRESFARRTRQKNTKKVIIVQSAMRRVFAKKAATEIVAAIQKRRATRRIESALRIQRCWRNYLAVRHFKAIIQGFVALQRMYRNKLTCRVSDKKRLAVIPIQRVARILLARVKLRRLKLQKEVEINALADSIRAATFLQAVARGHVVRRELRAIASCAVEIQRCVRGHMEQTEYYRAVANIVRTQKAVRGWLACRELSRLKLATSVDRGTTYRIDATKIQTVWRSYCTRAEFMCMLLSAIRIQTWYRSVLKQRAYRLVLSKATVIQSLERGHLARCQVSKQNVLATLLQAHVRTFLILNEVAKRYWALSTIQRHGKGFFVRQRLSLRRFAVKEIQRIWRGFSVRSRYKNGVTSAIRIQSFFRMSQTKHKVGKLWKQYSKKRHVAAVVMQSLLRKRLATRRTAEARESRIVMDTIARDEELLRCVLQLQSASRLFLSKKKESWRAKRVAAAINIQCALRIFLAKKHTVTFGAERQTSRLAEAAAKIFAAQSDSADFEKHVLHHRLSRSQGLVRGFLIRKSSSLEVRKSISLIREAEERSKLNPSSRLGARMERALILLQSSSNLTEIMNIVCTLEIATRFSKECCEEFVEGRATSILVALAPTCNKSLPHVELLYYIMCTLSNVSKHNSLVSDVATLDAATALVHLIRMYGSEDAIFCSAVSLLEMCALHNPGVPPFVASQKRLEGIFKSWERKLHHKKVIQPAPFKAVYKPRYLGKRCKAKTDMLILGISYNLEHGVSTLERLLSMVTRPTPTTYSEEDVL